MDWIKCPVCDDVLSLAGYDVAPTSRSSPDVHSMNMAADEKRDRDTATVILQGKRATQDFDVFLAHNSLDKKEVVLLADELRTRGLNLWVDEEQIPPGRWFQDVLQEIIRQVRSVAIILGPSGLGKWQRVELKTFVSRCVNEDIPVIPVLLPGVTVVPSNLPFLSELNWVRFANRISHVKLPFRWGISAEGAQETMLI